MSIIFLMPLSHFVVSDRLVWKFRKNGKFTIKTCYHRLYEENFEYGVRKLLYLTMLKLAWF